MRFLITGIDDEGGSCLVTDRPPTIVPFESGGIQVELATATESCPPPPRPPGRGGLVPMPGEPGIVRWNFISFPADTKTAVHHTDSVDFNVVLEGSVFIVLDDGPHRLDKGDAIVVNGVDHGWQTAASGCRMSTVIIATPPLEAAG
jgi:mannose-6-phosphate isomerase-like protein (cupin superfamily)